MASIPSMPAAPVAPAASLLSAAKLAAFVLSISLLYHITSLTRSWRRLGHIPGPAGTGWSKAWLLRNTLSGEMHLALKRACDDYGPLVRIGPNDLVTNDIEVVRRMWAVRSPYKKSVWYDAVRFDPDKDNLISTRDDWKHNELRGRMAHGYAGKDNESLEGSIDTEIANFISLVESKYISTPDDFRPIDLARKLQYLTLDVISSLAFDKAFGYLNQDADVHRYIEVTEKNMPVMMVLTVFPALARLLQMRFMRGMMPSERDRLGFGAFIKIAKQIVAERLASKDPHRKDMLGSFLRYGLSQSEAEGETLTQVIAGSDTTATALRATLLYLICTPSAYDALTSEIRQAAAERTISVPVSHAEAVALPYLQAVIREGLRIFPPVVGLMPTDVPAGGDTLCGFDVPAGTHVGWSAWSIQHDKTVYGDDAECFRPERWLEASPAKHRNMTASWELVFKYGKWQCLGKTVALMELNKVLVELLRRYDFALVDPSSPWTSFSAGIFVQHGLMVKMSKAKMAKATVGRN